MILGILVTTSRHLDDVIGITKAAVLKGHEVYIFVMDEAVQLLSHGSMRELAFVQGVSLSFCEVSARRRGANFESFPKEIVSGSQVDNARMFKRADRVVSL